MNENTEAGGAICGGPDPSEREACYGGCYEWCIHPLCGKTLAQLTATERKRIRRFQKRCGGYYPSDLRELSDFDLSPLMARALIACEMATGERIVGFQLPRQQAEALERRDLVYPWDDDRREWHVSGEGGHAAMLAAKDSPS